MEKTIIRLKRKIENLSSIVQRLENSNEEIPQIEVDLLLEELRRMYEVALTLKETSVTLPCQSNVQQQDEQKVDDVEVASNSVDASEESKISAETIVAATSIAATVENIEEEIIDSEETSQNIEESEEPKIVEPIVSEDANTQLAEEEALLEEETPLFAPEETTPDSVLPNSQIPSLEQIEGTNNEELFADEQQPAAELNPIPETTLETPIEEESQQSIILEQPAASEVAQPLVKAEVLAQEKQGSTLWEKLQGQQANQSFAEKLQSQQSIIDRLTEKPEQSNPTAQSDSSTSNIPTDSPVESSIPEAKESEIVQPKVQESSIPQSSTPPQPSVTATPSLFDYFKQTPPAQGTSSRTLGDMLNQKGLSVEEKLEQQANKQKVADLRNIININDKFSFMSELFHNNMKAYNDFIMRLNTISDREEALQIVSSVATQYNWDMDSLTVKTFYNILYRKY